MGKLFSNGDIVLVILGLMILEVSGLIFVRKKLHLVFRPVELLVSVAAGAALLMALRQALREAAWQRIAVWMIVALACHLWDLKLRLAARRTR